MRRVVAISLTVTSVIKMRFRGQELGAPAEELQAKYDAARSALFRLMVAFQARNLNVLPPGYVAQAVADANAIIEEGG